MSSTPVRTVVFDAGMTLVRPEPSFHDVFVRAAAECGVELDREAVKAAGFLWREHHDVWLDTGMPDPWVGDDEAEIRYFRELYQRFLDHLGVPADEAVTEHVLQRLSEPASFGLFPEVPDVLDDLSDRGIRLGLLSNWGLVMPLRSVLEPSGLLDRFEAVIISGEVGVAKPDPRIFALALASLGEEAGPHVAYVGDDLVADVAASRAVGLTSVLVDRTDRCPQHDGARVRDLRQLSEVLPLDGRA